MTPAEPTPVPACPRHMTDDCRDRNAIGLALAPHRVTLFGINRRLV